MKKKTKKRLMCLCKDKKILLGLAAGLAMAVFVAELPEMVRYCRMARL
ncbi:hypothetical protein [Geobacter sp. SVR]|nr:hypothetical protein [Geobacter sp. SVR]BCS52538.1 hypothetical protein GSVR_08460 [Geobacter sp. SVR]GCF84025.1 hypothetical protein GSbR_06250 [Geobacter sp. SVR]